MLRETYLTGENISVVIPSYNHEKYIESAVMSVVNQTVRNIEIVIIDDGSSDNSVAICKKLSETYPQIKLIAQSNQGAHVAINCGIQNAAGEFVAILNSDDLFEPEKIEKTLEILNNNAGIDFVIARDIVFIDEHSVPHKKGISIDWHKRATEFFAQTGLLAMSILNENFVVTTSNMVFSKKFWRTVSGFQPLRYCHDLQFLVEAAATGSVYVFSGNPHVRYRVHSQNTIKEHVSKVRVEIAAVIAEAVVKNKMRMVGDNASALTNFRQFLRNKNLSDLVIFFVMRYLQLSNKEMYYADVLQEDNKKRYSLLLD